MVQNFSDDTRVSKSAASESEHNQLINQLALDMVSSKRNALNTQAAPDSLVARYGLVTLRGVENLPSGIMHAGKDAVKHPLQTLEMAGGAAAMGALLKTVLPETGNAGKFAGVAIGAYFTYQAAKPFVESYKMAGNAKTMDDIDLSGVRLGDAGGSYLVNAAVAGIGYKLGAAGAARVLLRPGLDGFADLKQSFWDSVGNEAGKITDAMGLTSTPEPVKIASTTTLDPRLSDSQAFLPSVRNAPCGVLKGEVPANERIDVTVQLKSKASNLSMDRALKRIALGRATPMTDAEFTEKFGASQESLDAVSQFAKNTNLKIVEANLSSGRVVLSGTAGDFSQAFHTKLNNYEINGKIFTGHEGALVLPNSVDSNIEGVFGLDEPPQAHSYAIRYGDVPAGKSPAIQSVATPHPGDGPTDPAPGPQASQRVSYMPNEVSDAYNFPKGTTGKGQGVAIVEPGGGIDMNNEAAYYKAHGLKMPDIKVIRVDGATSSPGTPGGADGEVALDSQVVGAVAPDAKQAIIFAPSSERGFMDAITRGAFPEQGENPNQAISISWGGPIEHWSDQGKRGMNLAFKKAALKGISVFAASGDHGAVDNAMSGKFNVDYPAADPYVTGTGGTRLTIKDGKIANEVAWNNKEGWSTGGGISPGEVPDYQKGIKMPPEANGTGVPGRGVPDVAANADGKTGYKIRVGGREVIIGGTSAVAPLMSALAVRLNEGLGSGKQVGFMNPFLYKNAMAGTAPFFNDITSGDNEGYSAAKGWDPVTGWGSLNGDKLLSAYKADNSSLSTRILSLVPQELKTGRDVMPIPMNVHVSGRLRDSERATSFGIRK
jgi:kumamolisin